MLYDYKLKTFSVLSNEVKNKTKEKAMIDNLLPTPLPTADNRGIVFTDASAGAAELDVDKTNCINGNQLKICRSLTSVRFREDLVSKKERSENEGKKCINKESSFSSSDESLVVAETVSSVAVGECKMKVAANWSHGCMSVIGRRREMEDAVAVELKFLSINGVRYDFFGVYDGHGGACVAHACRDRLHSLVVQAVEEEEEEGAVVDWERVMVESFNKMDEEVSQISGPAEVANMGSTAVVAVVGEDVVVVANCGDSRAVMSRNGAAVALSCDHKPDRPDELERIEVSGGSVVNWNGQRVLGVLATSRSIGDHHLKPYIISEPEVIITKRTDTDEFLILASDGLWDVVSNEIACEVVRRCLNGRMRRKSRANSQVQNSCKLENESRAAEAAALLTELAIARGGKDNISIIVVELRKSGARTES